MRYRQCLLCRGTTYQVAWLPEPFCWKGKSVHLGKPPHLSRGWLVVDVYKAEPPAYVLEHKSHRRGDFGSLVGA